MKVSPNRKHWDGDCVGIDTRREEINRIGSSRVSIVTRRKEVHAKHARSKKLH